MFNLQPGQGLSLTASREIAFGLGSLLFLEGLIFVVETEYDQISRKYETQSILVGYQLKGISVESEIESAIRRELESRTIKYSK